ncbi:MAG: hypothetical protein CNIPEHKO_00021 [Anaerolineales bacterium]|nr:hypothetical protein [Anaerolineales bacterium]
MGFVLQASCVKCKYQSDKLVIGDGLHFIFICKNCNSVVNGQRFPFRYSWSPCPNCKNPFRKVDWVDGANLAVSFDEPTESEHQCPRCKANQLGFKAILHFSRSFDDRIPEKGTLVHGHITKSGKLEIPFLNVPFCVPLIEDSTSYASEAMMELRVTGLETEYTDDKSSIQRMKVFLEFIRYISQEDLDRESMEQPMVKSKTTEFIERATNNSAE